MVLSVSDHGESDKLVCLYTRERGRINGLAKGARRSSRRFVNKLEEFSLLRLYPGSPPRRGSGLLLIGEADLLNSHITLRQQHGRFFCGMLLCELLLRFTAEDDPDPRLFHLLLWSLDQASQGSRPYQATLVCHLRLLELSGYQPGLDVCGQCGVPLGDSPPGGFLPLAGSCICSACATRNAMPLLPLRLQTLLLLQQALRLDISRLQNLRFSPRALLEGFNLLGTVSRHLLGEELRCLHPLIEQFTPDSAIHQRTR